MIRGVNVDPMNPGGRPHPLTLRRLGATWVRLVSRDEPAVHDYAVRCHDEGLNVLAVVARESEGYMLPGADMHQIGNEPDKNSPSSWTRTPDEYIEDWRIYRELPYMLVTGRNGDDSMTVYEQFKLAPQLPSGER